MMRYGSLYGVSSFSERVREDNEADVDIGMLSLDIAYQESRDSGECEPETRGFQLDAINSALCSAADACEPGPELLTFDCPASIARPCHVLAGPSQWRDAVHCLMISATLHLAFLSAIPFLHTAGPTGVHGLGKGAIMVRLLHRENVTPEAPSPASVDSPGSIASLAKRVRKPDPRELKTRREEVTRAYHATQPSPEESSRPLNQERYDESLVPERREDADQDRAREDTITVKSSSLADSAASAPSIASAERQLITAEGKESLEFKDKILSAIHQAAYYPKAALRDKYHGEVAVAFTLARDGSIMSLGIEKKSGSPILDEAALQIIRKAAEKFPCFPDALTGGKVSYVVPIVFKEKRSKGQ
jgi:protein TonB